MVRTNFTVNGSPRIHSDTASIDRSSAGTVAIIGQGFSVIGRGTNTSGIMVTSGNVTLSNRTIADTVAKGGARGSGAYGGSGPGSATGGSIASAPSGSAWRSAPTCGR